MCPHVRSGAGESHEMRLNAVAHHFVPWGYDYFFRSHLMERTASGGGGRHANVRTQRYCRDVTEKQLRDVLKSVCAL